jgi:tRNA dimethylallyltransferase
MSAPPPNEEKSLPPLVIILGPTASGKSTLGVWLAERLGGEVVACDSTQLYRGFDIGTAKLTVAERRGIPHHLIDVLNATEPSTAGGYRQMAIDVLDDLRHRGRIPVLTVGTGLYLHALLDGLADLPQRSEELRERLRQSRVTHPPRHLHRILRRLDPQSAEKISSGDEQKLIRAIEICLLARRPLSEVHRTGRTPLQGWHTLKIGLNPARDALYARIHARTDAMLAGGWLDEVKALVASGLSESAKPFDFIGYRELRSVLRNEMTLPDARGAIQQSTRHYAKRQLTWFRREAGVRWSEGFGEDPVVQHDTLEWLRAPRLDPSRGADATRV